MNEDYIKIIVTSNVGADTCYDFVRYDYKVDMKSQIVRTKAFTVGFKKFEIEVVGENIYIIVARKKYEFKNFLCFTSIGGHIYEPSYKHNHSVGYIDYETLLFERKTVCKKNKRDA